MEGRLPNILVPFVPAQESLICRDVFLYLRPETNGIEVESLIMGVIRKEAVEKHDVKLAYLANLPGDFISAKGLVEHHYRIRLLFALKGKQLFTKHMKKVFKSYFRCSFENADIIGPYEAMKKLGLDEETLFKTWVKPSKMLNINGQSIKKIKDYFVLNYDIPALLNKNNINTDIAVMIFRILRKTENVNFIIGEVEQKLRDKGIINILSPPSRVFHYSKGPFEELLDSSGFLYDSNFENIPVDQVSFGRFLVKNGVTAGQIKGALYNPIMKFRESENSFVENDIFSYTKNTSYEEALKRFMSAYEQVIIHS